MYRPSLLVLITAWASGCVANAPVETGPPSPPADWLAWQSKRRESVAGTNGWTTLVGLHWLQEGRNFAGSNPTNHVVLPRKRVAASVGSFIRAGREVRFEAAPGVVSTVAGKPVQSVELQSDAALEPTVLQIGALPVIVIERGERIGLRVRDPEAPARTRFRGLKYFTPFATCPLPPRQNWLPFAVRAGERKPPGHE